MNVGRVIFSFDGRIGRQTFWLAFLVKTIVDVVILAIINLVGTMMLPVDGVDWENPGAEQWYGMSLLLLWLIYVVWTGLALHVKRWHDRNKSGFMVLVVLIPLVGFIWALVEEGFLRGTAGQNNFGPDPLIASATPGEHGQAILTQVKLRCRACKSVCDESAKFCQQCGAPL